MVRSVYKVAGCTKVTRARKLQYPATCWSWRCQILQPLLYLPKHINWLFFVMEMQYVYCEAGAVWNVMAHAQKPDFVFPRNGRVHLNRWGRQFSWLLAAKVCTSAWVMLDRPCSEVAWEYWLPTPFASFPFTSPPVRHRVPPGSEWALHII